MSRTVTEGTAKTYGQGDSARTNTRTAQGVPVLDGVTVPVMDIVDEDDGVWVLWLELNKLTSGN
jgi:hypothetical protein